MSNDGDGVKLFVYGVSGSCPRDLLDSEFNKFGRVTDIFNTGKGYAFVTMSDEADARDAIEELNGTVTAAAVVVGVTGMAVAVVAIVVMVVEIVMEEEAVVTAAGVAEAMEALIEETAAMTVTHVVVTMAVTASVTEATTEGMIIEEINHLFLFLENRIKYYPLLFVSQTKMTIK